MLGNEGSQQGWRAEIPGKVKIPECSQGFLPDEHALANCPVVAGLAVGTRQTDFRRGLRFARWQRAAVERHVGHGHRIHGGHLVSNRYLRDADHLYGRHILRGMYLCSGRVRRADRTPCGRNRLAVGVSRNLLGLRLVCARVSRAHYEQISVLHGNRCRQPVPLPLSAARQRTLARNDLLGSYDVLICGAGSRHQHRGLQLIYRFESHCVENVGNQMIEPLLLQKTRTAKRVTKFLILLPRPVWRGMRGSRLSWHLLENSHGGSRPM